MVTIQVDTLSVSLLEFLRDLLRENLTHPSGSEETWIFKDNPAEGIDADDFPKVILTDNGQKIEQIGLSGEMTVPKDLNVSITIYTFDPYTRDTISDQVRAILRDYTYADTNGDTMKTMLLTLKSISSSTNDIYANYPKPYRIKEFDCIFRYRGG